MAQWNSLCDLMKQEKIKSSSISILYGGRKKFPVKFRSNYATWIESQEWPTDMANDLAKRRYDEFIQMLKTDAQNLQNPMKQVESVGEINDFEEQYEGRHEEFVRCINNILRTESTLIQESNEPRCNEDRRFIIAQDNPELLKRFNALRAKQRNTQYELSRLEEGQEKMILELKESQDKINQQKKQLDILPEAQKLLDKLEVERNNSVYKLSQKRTDATNKVCSAYNDLADLLPLVWEEIDSWHKDHRLACTKLTKPKEQIMEVLDKVGESAAEVFMSMINQVDKLISILQKLPFKDDSQLIHMQQTLQPEMMRTLRKHLDRVFIVDKNIPKQVLKVTNGKSLGFALSVRFLGGFCFGLNVNQPKVSVRLYPEKQLEEAMNPDQPLPDGCCKIQNGQDKSFDFMRSGNCVANFNNVVVSSVKREGRGKNDEFVTDYKHAFIFETTVKIGQCGTSQAFRIKAMSLPLVITSQTSQECMARGTIIWSSAFLKPKEQRQVMFEAEEEVPWQNVASVINALFKEYTSLTLNKEHLHYLAKIAFRSKENVDFDKMPIQRSLVLKEKLPRKDFSFWKWLMSCLNSVKDHLQAEWKEGLIYGFISKEDAEIKLLSQSSGTFLIRFSESNIEQGQRADIHGCLTVAVADIHPNTGIMSVFHVKESLTPKDLTEKRLAPILEAYETDDYTAMDGGRNKKLLHNLWTPSKLIPFDDAFGKYIKQKESMNDGYNRGRYLIKIYLADASDRAGPMSPLSSTAAAPSPMSDVLSVSDFGPGSPGSELGFMPLAPTGAISLPTGPLTSSNQVPPMSQAAMVAMNPASVVFPNQATNAGSVQGVWPIGNTNTAGDNNIPNLGIDEVQDIINNLQQPGLLTVDQDQDIMLNSTSENAGYSGNTIYTTLQNVQQHHFQQQ